jgi:serine/threonine protein phosphatase PrpC
MNRLGSELQLAVGQSSHPGYRRPNNEDWLGTFQPDDAGRLARKGRLFLVADGMGGHRSGELASRRAVDQVIRGYLTDPASEVETSLRSAIEAANTSLYASTASAEGQSRWGTTLVAAVVRGGALWIASVGDSRAYLLRSRELRQLTRDHSLFPAATGERAGRHVITRALGTRPKVEVDLFPPLALQPGDRILLCTDGLTAPVSDEEIARVAADRPPQEAAEALVQAANDRGGPDNVSVILLEVAGSRPDPGLARWLRPEAWPGVVASLLGVQPAAGSRTWLFVIVLLLVLVLVGLGFGLGLILFR